MKAKTEIKVQCGCGFQTNNPLIAQDHVEKTGHSMDVSGKVYPVKDKA